MTANERWRLASEAVVITLPLVVLVFDAAARYFGGNGATISAVVCDAAHRWPVVAFVLGVIAGHWVWPVR